MAIGQGIYVHPYVFRQVCHNGMVAVQAIQTRRIHRFDSDAPAFAPVETELEIRHVVRLCLTTKVFSNIADHMMSAIERRELAISLSMLSRTHMRNEVLSEILARFEQAHDNSLFGLVNAVTSVARDEPDPERRWRLEELGGSMLIPVPPTPKPDSALADLAVQL